MTGAMDEAPMLMTITEITDMIPALARPTARRDAQRVGLIVMSGDHYAVRSPALLHLVAEATAAGVPWEESLQLARALRSGAQAQAAGLSEMLVGRLRDPDGDNAATETMARRVRLLIAQAAASLVIAELGRAIEQASPPSVSPLLGPKAYDEPSVFQVEAMLRETRRQRRLGEATIPEVCVLDPDGDTVRHLARTGQAIRREDWACYHSELWITSFGGREIGIVPCAVGGSYAVLVASELHASGSELIVSVTSAGQIIPLGDPPYFVLIERAWRDEGTSLHYLPATEWAHLDPALDRLLVGAFDDLDEPVLRGASWTTDAPFRETATAIASARAAGVHAVEMEAASLYAYAEATGQAVVCVAHVTNTMAVDGDDFEKGDDDGTHRTLAIIDAIARIWSSSAEVPGGDPGQ